MLSCASSVGSGTRLRPQVAVYLGMLKGLRVVWRRVVVPAFPSCIEYPTPKLIGRF